MLEIKEENNGELALEETDKAKGDEAWFFTELTYYIEKNRVNRDTLHHLCALSVITMEQKTYRNLKEAEIARLTSDLERMLMRIYYPVNHREFEAELEDEYLTFYMDGNALTKITMKTFEEDLKYEPDVKKNALQEIYYSLGSKRLSYDEREELADQIVNIYNDIVEQRSLEEMQEKVSRKIKEDKPKKEKKGLFSTFKKEKEE